MKRSIKSSVKTAMIMTAFLLLGALFFARPANAINLKFQYRSSGKLATVSFYGPSTECEGKGGSFWVSESMFKEGSGAPLRQRPSGFLYLYADNWCTEIYRYAFGEVDLSAYDISQKLESAHAAGSGSVTWYEWHWECDDSGCWVVEKEIGTETVTVEMEFKGIGDLLRGHNNSHSNTTGPNGQRVISRTRGSGSYRDAEATGSIAGETSMYTINPSSSFSQLNESKEGIISVEKTGSP